MEEIPKEGQKINVQYSHRKKIYFFIGRVLKINHDYGTPLVLVEQPSPWGTTSRWCELEQLTPHKE